MIAAPRILIAGTNSGCGKTTLTCALLQAYLNRGLAARAAKCGPDYIDPMFHSRVIGAKSCNLDPFFFDDTTLNGLLADHASDAPVTVIEGVMGYYDGLSMDTWGSTYEVARRTQTPVILAVNARGASLSLLALIQGFLEFQPESNIRGVIFNQCSPMTYPMLAEALQRRFPDLRPCGYLPPLPECILESRHLGLVTAQEITDWKEKLAVLAGQAEKSLDLDGILELAASAPPLENTLYTPKLLFPGLRIAVARDKAFCFYYEDSLSLLERLGAELVPFSPLTDACLPPDIHGLYLGGGYPELYADALSGNKPMLASVRATLENKLPCIAECGGFMYLTQAIAGKSMVGFLPGSSFDNGKLTRFGYVTLTAKEDNLLCAAGESIPGHEFHHWDAEFPGASYLAEKPNGRHWDCVHATGQLYAGYPHFHFYANPGFAENFCRACQHWKEMHPCQNK